MKESEMILGLKSLMKKGIVEEKTFIYLIDGKIRGKTAYRIKRTEETFEILKNIYREMGREKEFLNSDYSIAIGKARRRNDN